MDKQIELDVQWEWGHDYFRCSLIRVRGGTMPKEARTAIESNLRCQFTAENPVWEIGKRIEPFFVSMLPEPEPLNVGTESLIEGTISGLQWILGKTIEDEISVSYHVSYTNETSTRFIHKIPKSTLPSVVMSAIKEMERQSYINVRDRLIEKLGGVKIDKNKWKSERTVIFISHRDSATPISMKLWEALGEYESRSLFIPRIDKVDMRSGRWLLRIEEMLNECKVFIPVLTKDYLDGPISNAEFYQALQGFYSGGKEIVPLLVEGKPEDYEGRLAGGITMVQAQNGLSDEIVHKVARLALGLSMGENPYE